MKINFHQVHNNPYIADSPDALMNKFQKLYANYRIERKILHDKEKILNDSPKELRQVLQTKEELSKIAMALHNHSDSIEKLESLLRKLISTIGSESQYLTASYIYPFSLKTTNIRSPINSIWATLENLKIISEFAECSKDHANGMLCSGTNAFGAFYAVRGKTPQILINLGIKPDLYDSFSDIDLLISCENIHSMESLMERYVDNRLFENREKIRFMIFKKLFMENRADMFSVRAHHKGTEESIHFVFDSTLSEIANFAEKHKKNGMGFIADFRPNMPKLTENGEYPITNTISGPDSFKTEIVEIKSSEETSGFLWQMPANGISENEGESQYKMGILAFFLLISPIILIDKNGVISSNLERLLRNVRGIIHKDKLVHFARRDKMALEIRTKVEKLLKGETL